MSPDLAQCPLGPSCPWHSFSRASVESKATRLSVVRSGSGAGHPGGLFLELRVGHQVYLACKDGWVGPWVGPPLLCAHPSAVLVTLRSSWEGGHEECDGHQGRSPPSEPLSDQHGATLVSFQGRSERVSVCTWGTAGTGLLPRTGAGAQQKARVAAFWWILLDAWPESSSQQSLCLWTQ